MVSQPAIKGFATPSIRQTVYPLPLSSFSKPSTSSALPAWPTPAWFILSGLGPYLTLQVV